MRTDCESRTRRSRRPSPRSCARSPRPTPRSRSGTRASSRRAWRRRRSWRRPSASLAQKASDMTGNDRRRQRQDHGESREEQDQAPHRARRRPGGRGARQRLRSPSWRRSRRASTASSTSGVTRPTISAPNWTPPSATLATLPPRCSSSRTRTTSSAEHMEACDVRIKLPQPRDQGSHRPARRGRPLHPRDAEDGPSPGAGEGRAAAGPG